MLVELQLTHSQSVKETIDKAWGIGANKNKKKDGSNVAEHSGSIQESLQTVPVAQDCSRLRYWHFDGMF